jgi:neurofibromin 1
MVYQKTDEKLDYEASKVMDLNIAVLKTMNLLLKDLELHQCEENGFEVKQSDFDGVDVNLRHKLFLKFFRFFLKALDSVTISDNTGANSDVTRPKVSSKPLLALKCEIIGALSNLISSNMDIGIRHSISITYNEDPMLRGVILQVFSNILRYGSSGSLIQALEEPKWGAMAKYTNLLNLLCEKPFLIIVGLANLCSPDEIDELVDATIELFSYKGVLPVFLMEQAKIELNHVGTFNLI